MTSYHDESYLRTLKKKDLQDILRTQDQTISGNKSELITRILSASASTTASVTYAFVRGSDAFEKLMSCFEEWCKENDYALYKQTTSVRFEKVDTNEFRHHMAGVETTMDFLDRFWICWMNETWSMYDNSDEEDLKDETFMREFQEIYAKKMAIMMTGCCIGCIEGQPNQLAHMGQGGCLHTEEDSDSDSDSDSDTDSDLDTDLE